MSRVELLGRRKTKNKVEREMKVGDIKILSAEGKYREWTEEETKPFGAHKYVSLNGNRKGVELLGVFMGTIEYYGRKEEDGLIKVFTIENDR